LSLVGVLVVACGGSVGSENRASSGRSPTGGVAATSATGGATVLPTGGAFATGGGHDAVGGTDVVHAIQTGGFKATGGTTVVSTSPTGGINATGGAQIVSTSLTGGTDGSGGASGGASSTTCVNETYHGGANDCSYSLPLPCVPCIACNPLPAGDNSGCAAPTGPLAGPPVITRVAPRPRGLWRVGKGVASTRHCATRLAATCSCPMRTHFIREGHRRAIAATWAWGKVPCGHVPYERVCA
jgi:two-component system, chemotaxis family, sensor kinase CheA